MDSFILDSFPYSLPEGSLVASQHHRKQKEDKIEGSFLMKDTSHGAALSPSQCVKAIFIAKAAETNVDEMVQIINEMISKTLGISPKSSTHNWVRRAQTNRLLHPWKLCTKPSTEIWTGLYTCPRGRAAFWGFPRDVCPHAMNPELPEIPRSAARGLPAFQDAFWVCQHSCPCTNHLCSNSCKSCLC